MPDLGISIERVLAPTPDAWELIAERDAVLVAVYDPEQRHGLSIEQVFQPEACFFIARLGDAAVGCGAFGHYAGLPPHQIATSLFYEKPL